MTASSGTDFACHGGEDPVRTQLQERRHALFREGADAVGEAHGLTDVTHPVPGRAQLLGRRHTTGQVRTTGMTGSAYDRLSATARNSSSIGSINGEWNACETRSQVALRLFLQPRRDLQDHVLVTGDQPPTTGR